MDDACITILWGVGFLTARAGVFIITLVSRRPGQLAWQRRVNRVTVACLGIVRSLLRQVRSVPGVTNADFDSPCRVTLESI